MGVQGAEAEYRLFMKGASEVLAQICSRILTRQGEQEFGPGNGLEQLEVGVRKIKKLKNCQWHFTNPPLCNLFYFSS
jgi:magnesium-transporting ATPase (P-type)